MPPIGKAKSVLLTKILSYIIFICCAMAVFLIPFIVKFYFQKVGLEAEVLITAATILLYASLPPAIIANIYLFRLLSNIEHENVFIYENVNCLRLLSWCCFFVGILYTAAGFYFNVAFVIAFAAFFFCLVIRVIKNVFEAAVELKQINDYTI